MFCNVQRSRSGTGFAMKACVSARNCLEYINLKFHEPNIKMLENDRSKEEYRSTTALIQVAW